MGMTSITTVSRGGTRFYVDPSGTSHPSVTSIIGMEPKPWLASWAAREAAELAVNSIDFLADMAQRDRAGAVDYIRKASSRYAATRRELGSAAHDVFERQLRGEPTGHVHPDVVPLAEHFADFLRTVQPRLLSAEDVVWSDTYGYAGSADAFLEYGMLAGRAVPLSTQGAERVTHVVDWKTGKSVYGSVAMQLRAYAEADTLISPDGRSQPVPAVTGGAALHITADGWQLLPVDIFAEGVWGTFLALRQAWVWHTSIKRRVIADPTAGNMITTGTQRRAA